MPDTPALRECVANELARPVHHDLHTLKDALLEQWGGAISALLFYGSCLRTDTIGEGLIDLYVVVDDYRDIHPARLGQWANAWLPPSIFFFRTAAGDGMELRAKCAIVSVADFEKGTCTWFQSYLWARFAQPSRLVFSRDDATRGRVERAIEGAVRRLVNETLPLQPATFDSTGFWTRALALTYGTELRPENSGRPALIAQQNKRYFEQLLTASARTPELAVQQASDSCHFLNRSKQAQRRRQVRRWKARKVQGRSLNVLRLLKSLFTTQGGVDYALWKLERHWGHPIARADQVRRYPLLYCWPLLWRLLRQRRGE
ncbi:hypothetical protein [Pseudomonas sp. RIT-To-2]|uniref:hypothetical protein n=1 Tax=Pseudomonas sp. RIT-To-2 TaxID=3462541 RepID=UPI002413210E